VVLARLLVGTLGVWRAARRAAPADDPAWVMLVQRIARELGIRRPVTLLIGRTGTVPVTWGVVYPVVLLPADADGWSEERRRAVLLHELAHVERFDALTHVLGQLALALFWFDPLVAYGVRRMRAERERACDDLVLAVGTRPTEYADDLLDLVRSLGEAPAPAAALAMARRSEFEGRLLAILDPAVPRGRTSRRATALAGAVVLLAVVPLAGMRPVVARPTAPPPAPRAVRHEAVPLVRAAPAASTSRSAGASCPHARGETVLVGNGPSRLYRLADDVRCLEVVARGDVELTDDGRDVRRLADGATLRVAEWPVDGGRAMRTMDVFGDRGVAVRTYRVDGAVRPPGEGRSWFESVLGVASRRHAFDRAHGESRGESRSESRSVRHAAAVVAAGLAAPATVADAATRPDVAAVLADVRRLPGSADRRDRLTQLAGDPTLGDDALRQVAEAARPIPSSGDRAAVLRAVLRAASGGESPTAVAAVVAAARELPSSGDRRSVLEAATAAGLSSTVLVDLLDVTAELPSSGDQAALLERVAARAGETPAVLRAYFAAVSRLTSDGDRTRVLGAALAAPASDAVLAGALDQARNMASSDAMVRVLLAVLPHRRMERAAVRERWFTTVDAVVSESARRAALLAVLRAEPACVDVQRGVIASAARLASDHQRASVLVAVARGTDALRNATLRARFLDASRAMTSDAEYRRVLDAALP
jgi:hypothetical protein